MDTAGWEAAGLYDPSAPDADDRLTLLEYLDSQGVEVDELQAAAAEGRLIAVLGDRLIQPGKPEHTAAEVSERSGLSPDVLDRLWRALGLPLASPDAVVFSDGDIEALTLLRVGAERFGLDAVLQLSRVVGSSLARIAEAEAVTVMLGDPNAFVPTASSTVAAARAAAELSGLLTSAAQAYDVLHRHHVAAALRRFDAAVPPDAMSAEIVDVAVGFADLVGFSVLAERLDLQPFADAVRGFAATASDVVATAGGRVVKLIGDEVMFVARDATQGIAIGLELLGAFADHAVLPPLRAAVAAGRVVGCDGDYFGSVVNVAARLVELAEPNTLVVTDAAVTHRLREQYEFEDLGVQLLRGVERPTRVARVQRPRPG